MDEHTTFIPLLIVIFLAFIVPLVLSKFKRLRLPIVVGELIAGILVGRSGFGLVEHSDPVLTLLAEFGFVFLMFLSGMEIDFSALGLFRRKNGSGNGGRQAITSRRWGPIQIGSIVFIITLVLSTAVGFLFQALGFVQNPWMMALILSTTSLGVVVPVLKEKGISSGTYGQSLLIAALIADFATMFLITVLVAILSVGLTLEVLLIAVLFAAFLLMYRFGLFFVDRLPLISSAMEELSSATSQIKVRAAFTIMLIFVALSEQTGTEIILGAFLAGAIISLLKRPEDHDLENQLNSIGFGFFIPIFFIMVGVEFNLSALTESPEALILAPLLIIAAFAVKFIPALVFKVAYTWRQTLGAGAILSARLSLIIAASAIGLRLGIISEPVNASIVLVSLITVSISPLIFNKIIPEPEDEYRPIVVVGAGEIGIQVAENLSQHGEKVVVIAKNNVQKERVERRELPVLVAKGRSFNADVEHVFETARSVVCVYSDSAKSYKVCRQAKAVYGINHVVARVDDPLDMAKFEDIGVATMNATMDQTALLAMLARNSAMYSLLTRTDDDKDIREIKVSKNRHFGKRIRDLNMPGDVLIVALKRQNKFMIPTGDTRLESGDKISLLGKLDCLEKSVRIFE